MRQLLNTLYVLSEDAYLTLDGETVVVNRAQTELARIPLHTLEGIVCFSYAGASPALMGKCARLGVDLSFYQLGNHYQNKVEHVGVRPAFQQDDVLIF